MSNKGTLIKANKIYKYKIKKIEELVKLNIEKEKNNKNLITILTQIKDLINEDTDKYQINEDEVKILQNKIKSLEEERDDLIRLNNDYTDEENKYLQQIDNLKKEIDNLKNGINNYENKEEIKENNKIIPKSVEEEMNGLRNKIKLLEDENNNLNIINDGYTEDENNYIEHINNLENEIFSLKYGDDLENPEE